jgi:hypothetical protein
MKMSEERENAVSAELQYLTSILAGLRFPAKRWQIIAWASYNGAGLQLVGAMQNMPEIAYQSVGHVGQALNEVSPGWW